MKLDVMIIERVMYWRKTSFVEHLYVVTNITDFIFIEGNTEGFVF